MISWGNFLHNAMIFIVIFLNNIKQIFPVIAPNNNGGDGGIRVDGVDGVDNDTVTKLTISLSVFSNDHLQHP